MRGSRSKAIHRRERAHAWLPMPDAAYPFRCTVLTEGGACGRPSAHRLVFVGREGGPETLSVLYRCRTHLEPPLAGWRMDQCAWGSDVE